MEVKEDALKIKKILIKCPPLLDDSFLIFPFLMAISEEFPKAEMNLLCEEGTSAAFSFLPFKVRAFERPRDKLSFVQTHHFCANLHDVFNVDLFFDLENTFNSSFMGFNFSANERVGYGVGWNKYFLTKNYSVLGDLGLEQKCIKLLELYLNRPFDDLKISRVRVEGEKIGGIEQLFSEPVPPKFILVMLDNFQNVTAQIEKWTKFFDCFHQQKFIIWSLQDEELISELFTKIDLGQNDLYMQKQGNSRELIYLLNKVSGVVANNLWSEGLCNYYGVNFVNFIFQNTQILPLYRYFCFKPQRILFLEPNKLILKSEGEDREFQEMNQVVDHLHFYFKL
jgi:ADP-heptose:LPS heptosyltransferase